MKEWPDKKDRADEKPEVVPFPVNVTDSRGNFLGQAHSKEDIRNIIGKSVEEEREAA